MALLVLDYQFTSDALAHLLDALNVSHDSSRTPDCAVTCRLNSLAASIICLRAVPRTEHEHD